MPCVLHDGECIAESGVCAASAACDVRGGLGLRGRTDESSDRHWRWHWCWREGGLTVACLAEQQDWRNGHLAVTLDAVDQ